MAYPSPTYKIMSSGVGDILISGHIVFQANAGAPDYTINRSVSYLSAAVNLEIEEGGSGEVWFTLPGTPKLASSQTFVATFGEVSNVSAGLFCTQQVADQTLPEVRVTVWQTLDVATKHTIVPGDVMDFIWILHDSSAAPNRFTVSSTPA